MKRQQVGQALRTIRKAQGLTQKQAAVAAGHSTEGAWRRVESGKNDLSTATLETCADALGAEVFSFLRQLTSNKTSVFSVPLWFKINAVLD